MDKKNFFSFDRIINKFKNKKFLQYLLIVILIILAFFLFFGDLFKIEQSGNVDDVTSYVNTLENKLTKTLSRVDGAGKVAVVISVKSGMETVLATETLVTETESKKETLKTPLIVNGKTVVLKELYPEIGGVLIVCEGADKISVMSKIQQATMSLLDVKIDQIEILSMK